ncbi:MAG: PAS domain-containing sensor histidine kinase [Chloroflexi bacterium]|nr:MAG: PAS domain-containing sensor histidine kinase [Chloroflexota bacterium]
MAVTQTEPADRTSAPPKRTLADLAHGPEAIRLLVDAVLDYAIFLIGPDGNVLTWNQGAERIKGYKAHEVIGKHISMFYTAKDVEAGRPERVLRQAERQGRAYDEGWRLRKDGTRFWADASVHALYDHGRLYGFAKITRDMTDARAAAERERQLDVEREARLAAEEALRARDRFLSIASHELKTPVASLQLSVDSLLLNRERGNLDQGRIERGLERIERAVRRMSALLVELLDVSRLERGATEFHFTDVDLSGIAEEVIDRFAGVEPKDRILFDLKPTLVQADAARIEQVISNLLDNALKYSSRPGPVHVAITPTEQGALIEVRDRGVGLSLDRKDRLFEPFSRGDNAVSVPGMGLGLFISREIVAGHGGRISAESGGDGKGTTFRVTLPRTQSDRAHAPG